MLRKLSSWFRETQERRRWAALYHEVLKNLEIFQVMAQRKDLQAFSLDEWKRVQDKIEGPDSGEILKKYAARLEAHNQSYGEFESYQKWYAQDIRHKTYDHAKILHQKKEKIDDNKQGLEEIIKSACRHLRGQLK